LRWRNWAGTRRKHEWRIGANFIVATLVDCDACNTRFLLELKRVGKFFVADCRLAECRQCPQCNFDSLLTRIVNIETVPKLLSLAGAVNDDHLQFDVVPVVGLRRLHFGLLD